MELNLQTISSWNTNDLRAILVATVLEWEHRYGVAPSITSAISEFDAAILVGHTPQSISKANEGRTAVTKGTDFIHEGLSYQVKANRPSGKPGSDVTLVGKANNYEWDRLIWILYDRAFRMVEAWEWNVNDYQSAFDQIKHIRPSQMRNGHSLFKTS